MILQNIYNCKAVVGFIGNNEVAYCIWYSIDKLNSLDVLNDLLWFIFGFIKKNSNKIEKTNTWNFCKI